MIFIIRRFFKGQAMHRAFWHDNTENSSLSGRLSKGRLEDIGNRNAGIWRLPRSACT